MMMKMTTVTPEICNEVYNVPSNNLGSLCYQLL